MCLAQLGLQCAIHSPQVIDLDPLELVVRLDLADFLRLIIVRSLLPLNCLLRLFDHRRLQLELLLQLLVLGLLLLDDSVPFDDLLLALFQLLLHLLDLRLVHAVGVCQLGALFLQGGGKSLGLLVELLLVLELSLQALNQHHLLSD